MDGTLHIPRALFHREQFLIYTRLQKERAADFTVRIWLYFADQANDTVLLRNPIQTGGDGKRRPDPHDPAIFVMEEACTWPKGEAGLMVNEMIFAGILEMKERDGFGSLKLKGFAEANAHLMPGYETIQTKGARKAGEKREREAMMRMAGQERQILTSQSILALDELPADTSPEAIDEAICFIMGIDRAGDQPLRKHAEYEKWMITSALQAMRSYLPGQINCLLRFLQIARIDPTVEKGAGSVLKSLSTLMTRAMETCPPVPGSVFHVEQ